MITITLSAPTPSLNETMKWHWTTKKKAKVAWAWEIAPHVKYRLHSSTETFDTWVRVPDKPMPRARITVTRYASRLLDQHDNLAGGCKGLIDVLQPMHPKLNAMGLGIIAGDAPHQLQCEYRQEKCKRAEARTVITIEEWVDDDLTIPPAQD